MLRRSPGGSNVRGNGSSWERVGVERGEIVSLSVQKKKESLNASALGLELVVHVLNTGAIVLVGKRGEHSSSFPMSTHTHALGVQPWTWLKSVFTEGDILDPEKALKI